MTPCERIHAIIHRKPVDRIPVDLWYTSEVYSALAQYTGASNEIELAQKLGIDKIMWAAPMYQGKLREAGIHETANHWGNLECKIQAGAATYTQSEIPALSGIPDPARIADYPYWPDPNAFAYDAALQNAKKIRQAGFATCGLWISVLEIYCQMRGIEVAMIDLAEEEEFVDAAMTRIFDIQTTMLEKHLKLSGHLIDYVFISDDLASQESLLISESMWEKYLKDRLKTWCDLIHSYGVKVMFHSDGAVARLIPRLIECGIDILNPIQHACTGMECEMLKKKFGDQIIFYGGVENQKIIPFGTPADVRAETRRCLETLGKGGGYICCSCHNIQAGTPVDNILELIHTAHEEGSRWL